MPAHQHRPQKIAAAALRVGDRIFTGRTHFEAMHKILALPSVSGDQKAEMMLQADDGFLTDDGQFVDREQGYVIAQAARQLKDLPQSTPQGNIEFYGGEQPKLDSGLIESYAPVTLRRFKAGMV